MKIKWLAAIMALATGPCVAADTNAADALLRIDAQKRAMKTAINLRRSGLIANQSFRTYADAINKICGTEPVTNVANLSKNSTSSALSLLSGTKDAIRAAIGGMGASISASDPLSKYAQKIKSINCPSSPGYVDSNIITTNKNPEDKVDFQCANETVCDVLAGAVSCAANTIYVPTGNCVGTAKVSDWKVLYKFTANTGWSQNYPLTRGNIYRFDMRGQTCVRNWLYMPAHDTRLYSFQLNCNQKADCPCVGMVTAKNVDAEGYDYSTNSGSQWITIGKCGEDSCDDGLTIPGVSKEMIEADPPVGAGQPPSSLWIYKLGS